MEYTKKELMENKILNEDAWENALMIAGFVPVIGEIADIILIIRYLKNKEYLYAAIMLIALIPTVGDIIAKPFIKLLKGGAGKAALRSVDDMAAYLAKNPTARRQYEKMGKYFDHPSVKKTVEKVSSVNSSWGGAMSKSLSDAKSVLGRLKPVQMGKRIGKEVAAGGKVSKGMKSFFRDEKLAQYIAKKGVKPSTWLGHWWHVIRAGRKSRRDMFRSLLMSSNVLHSLGLPSLKNDSDIEAILKNPTYAEAIANDPQMSNFIANNTDQSEVSNISGMGSASSPGMSGLETFMGLKTLKALAKMYV